MHLSNLLHVPMLLTMLPSTSASLLSNPDGKPDLTNTPSPSLQPRSLGLHRDTLSNSDRFTTGPFKVYMLKSIALIPLNIAAHEMSDFFTVVAQAGHAQKLAGRITSHYDFGFGAITKFLNTMPATADAAAPPLDWDLVMWIGSQLTEMTNLGGTEHFVAVIVDPATKVQTFVTLQVISAGLTTIGFLDPQTGRPMVPATNYFNPNR